MERICQSTHIFYSKHFAAQQNGFQLLEIASTTGKMISNTLFSFCWSNLLYPLLNDPIPDAEFSSFQLIFQSDADFYFHMRFPFNICIKKEHSSNSKHFHGGGFNFHDINVQSTPGDLISNSFIGHI